jgi:hypothetical protein
VLLTPRNSNEFWNATRKIAKISGVSRVNAKARDELRAEMIAFACLVDDEGLDGEVFEDAINAFFA